MGKKGLYILQAGRGWAFVVITLVPLFLLLWPTLEGIFSRWLKFDESYSHGFLLLLVCLFLLFRSARRITLLPGFYPLWLAPLIFALLVYGLGEILRVEALQHLMVIPLILGALAIFLGWEQVRWFIAPIGLLFFAIPAWDYLSWMLQLITVEVTQLLLGMLDIRFEVEGVFVYLIGVGAFEVAHGCSGLRYLLVGQSLALIYGELYFRCLRSRMALLLVALLFALIANWIRVFVIIYMGYETDMQSSLIKDHDNFGWWVFTATLVPLFVIGRKLEMMPVERNSPEQTAVAIKVNYSGRPAATGVILTAALPFTLWFVLINFAGKITSGSEELTIDLGAKNYGPLFDAELHGWKPRIINPDFTYSQTFFDREMIKNSKVEANKFYLGVFGYEYQRKKAEIIQYSNRLYRNDEWLPVNFFDVLSPSGVALEGVTLKGLAVDKKLHLASTYYVGGAWETDQWKAKLTQLTTLFGSRKDASLVVFAIGCDKCDGPSRIQEFVDDTMPLVVRQIDEKFER